MSRTRNKLEQLWHRQQEIQDLRDKEEQEELAEVSKDSNHCEGHAREIAKRVAHKNTRWILIVDEQRNGARNKWYHQIHTKNVIVSKRT